MWLGTHPASPSFVVGHDGGQTLVDVLADLGEPPLSFLLKVLAAETPLSIQVHPTAAQARAGFDRENAAGISLDSPSRNYRDPGAKPELIMAVGDFEALSGFRPVAESVSSIRRFAQRAGEIGDESGRTALEAWAQLVERDGLSAALAEALGAGPVASRAVTALTELVTRGDGPSNGNLASDTDTVRRLSAGFGSDPSILTALLLNRVTLRDGQALFLDAGNLHAYLGGLGIEIMGASDNVLRGGLTSKHVDTEEVLAVTREVVLDDPRCEALSVGTGVRVFRPSGAGFSLFDITAPGDDAGRGVDVVAGGPGIALCLDGELTVAGAASSHSLTRGRSAYISPDEFPFRVSGSGRMVLGTPAE